MDSPPTVSIITRLGNRYIFLKRVCESVLNQSYPHWEHIVVNDCCRPETLECGLKIFRQRYGGRLRIIHRTGNPNMQEAGNLGVQNASGKYLCIHDDDDSWHPRFLEHTVSFMNKAASLPGSPRGVIAQTERILEGITPDGSIIEFGRDPYQPVKRLDLRQAAVRNPYPPIAFLYERSIHDEIGLYDPRFTVLGDWDFHLRFLLKSEIGVLPHTLAYYHWRITPTGGNTGNTVTEGIEEHHTQKQHLINHYLRSDRDTAKALLGKALSETDSWEKETEIALIQKDQLGRIEGRLESTHQRLRRWEALLTGKWRRLRKQSLPAFEPEVVDPPIMIAGTEFLLEKWSEEVTKAEVISIDLFDTAWRRRVRHYRDVFLLWEQQLKSVNPSLGGISIAQIRLWAESAARREHPRNEPTLEEIYQRLGSWLEDFGFEFNLNHARELELQIELSLLFVRPEIKPFLETAIHSGKPLLYLSDMYLPAELLARWIQKTGLPDGKLHVSNENGMSKEKGEAFKFIQEKLGLESEKCLHIGDNAHSDFHMATQCGWKAFHIGSQTKGMFWDECPDNYSFYPEDLLGSQIYGIVREGLSANSDSYWENFGWQCVGPLHLAYLIWIHTQSLKDGGEVLYFLARDGYDLHRFWSKISQAWGIEIPGKYLLASRRMLNFPALNLGSKEAIDFLVTPNPDLKTEDFFLRIGLKWAEVVRDVGVEGLPLKGDILTTHEGLFRNKSDHHSLRSAMQILKPRLEIIQQREKTKLVEYLKDQSCVAEKMRGARFVDIGWQGSSAQSLQKLLLPENCGNIKGYYFATWETAKEARRAGCDIQTYFMDEGKPDHRARLLRESVGLIENCFTAPHPSITGVEKQNGEWLPIYDTEINDDQINGYFSQIRKGSSAFIERFIKETKAVPAGNGYSYIEPLLKRVLSHPTVEDARNLGKLPHQESFGMHLGKKSLAEYDHTTDGIKNRLAYQRSGWKKGLSVLMNHKK